MSSAQAATDSRAQSVRESVSEAEWRARVELAALYRSMVRLGMTDHIYNHITLRVPGEPEHFLVNAFGMTYQEVTASSFYKIDHDGNVVLKPENDFGLNRAAFVIHSAIHRGRPDLNCVMHTHTRATMAVSVMAEGLLPLTVHASRFTGRISYHDYMGPVVNLAEQKSLLADLGPKNQVMLLRNHGTLVCGRTIAETFINNYFLEMACKVQVDVMRAGADLILPTAEVLAESIRIMEEYEQDGKLEWAAMMRMIDADGEDYAH